MPPNKKQTRVDKIITYFTKDKPKVLLLKNLLSVKKRLDNSTLIEFGATSDEQRLGLCLTDIGSLLIAGDVDSGKTTFLKSIIGALARHNTSRQLKFFIATSKPNDFKILSKSPYLEAPIITTPIKLLNQISILVQEMEARYILLVKAGFYDTFWYNSDSKKPKINYIVFIIDNYSSLIESLPKTKRKYLEDNLISLVRMARIAGIHIILSTQEAHARAISGSLNVNFTNRLGFKTKTKKDSRDIHFESGCENLLGKGDAILSYYNDGGIMHRLQTPYISDAELKKLVK